MASPASYPLRLKSNKNDESPLHHVALLELLHQDPRPTFVIDTTPDSIACQRRCVLSYWNPAMGRVNPGGLLQQLGRESVIQHTDRKVCGPFIQFRDWLSRQDTPDEPLTYHGFRWTKVHVSGRWNVLSGVCATLCENSHSPKTNTLTQKPSKMNVKAPSFDWTDEIPPEQLSNHASWARSIDWASTPLGPMHSWSPQLRSICNLVMMDPNPAVVFYGPDLVMVYNEAEIELLGGFHPCMGASARVALAPVWEEYFDPIIEKNLAGETVHKTNTVIHMVRNGFMEETYFSLKFIPILDSEGTTIGHYEPLVETVRYSFHPHIL